MAHEYWGTFSIFDHRDPIFRRALVLFDRIVVPVPKESIGDLMEEELDLIRSDVAWLEEKKAAILIEWDVDEFRQWKDSRAAETISAVYNKDPQYATRMQMFEQSMKLKPYDVDYVTAIPVYAARSRYDNAMDEFGIWTALSFELGSLIPVPDKDAPLEDIILLKETAIFREATYNLRSWMYDTVPKILASGKESDVHDAVEQYRKWVGEYEKAIKEARFKKVRASIISVLLVGAALEAGLGAFFTAAAAIAPPIFDLKTLTRPCWKEIAEKKCAPGGVIYEGRKRLKRGQGPDH